MFPTTFCFIWPSSFKGEDFLEITYQKQELPVVAMFLADLDEMSNLYRGPSIDASYQVSVHLARLFQRRRFLEINQSETRIVYGSHVCKQIGLK